MEEFVLDEAIKCPKFGDISPQDSAAVHQSKSSGDLALFLKDLPERITIFNSHAERFINEDPTGFDELPKRGGRGKVVFLAVSEKSDQAIGVFLKDCFAARKKSLVPDGVIVK